VGVLGHSMLGTVWSTEIPAFFFTKGCLSYSNSPSSSPRLPGDRDIYEELGLTG
jgi:hypothetical protein